MQKRLNLKIYGRVQGVFFREESRRRAQELRLQGFVRNHPDGTVILCAEGPEGALQELLQWAETGPRLAKVDRIEADWQEPKGEFEDFSVLS